MRCFGGSRAIAQSRRATLHRERCAWLSMASAMENGGPWNPRGVLRVGLDSLPLIMR